MGRAAGPTHNIDIALNARLDRLEGQLRQATATIQSFASNATRKFSDIGNSVTNFALRSGDANKAIKDLQTSFNSLGSSAAKSNLSLVQLAKTFGAFQDKSYKMKLVMDTSQAQQAVVSLEKTVSAKWGRKASEGLVAQILGEADPGQEAEVMDILARWGGEAKNTEKAFMELQEQGMLRTAALFKNLNKDADTPMGRIMQILGVMNGKILSLGETWMTAIGTKFAPILEALEPKFAKIIEKLQPENFNLDKLVDGISSFAKYISNIDVDRIVKGIQSIAAGIAKVVEWFMKLPNSTKAILIGITLFHGTIIRVIGSLIRMGGIIGQIGSGVARMAVGGRGGLHSLGQRVIRNRGRLGALARSRGIVGSTIRSGALRGVAGVGIAGLAGTFGAEGGMALGRTLGLGQKGQAGVGLAGGALAGGMTGFMMGGPIGAAIGALIGAAKPLAILLGGVMKPAFERLNNAFKGLLDAIKPLGAVFANLVIKIGSMLSSVFTFLQPLILAPLNGLVAAISWVAETITSIINKVVSWLPDSLKPSGGGGGSSQSSSQPATGSAATAAAAAVAAATATAAAANNTQNGGTGQPGLDPLLDAMSRLEVGQKYLENINSEMDTLAELSAQMGEGAEVGGVKLSEMFKRNLKLSKEFVSEERARLKASMGAINEKLRGLDKELAAANQIKDPAEREKKVEEVIRRQGKLREQYNNALKLSGQLELQNVKALDAALAPLNQRLSIKEKEIEQSQLILDIQSNLYGTAALSIKASMQQIQKMNESKAILQQQLDLVKEEIKVKGDVPALRQRQLDIENKILSTTSQQVKLAQQLKDGYLSAITAQATSAGRFSKIIIDQDKNLQQSSEKALRKQNYLLGQTGTAATASSAKSYRFGAGGMGQIVDSAGVAQDAAGLNADRVSKIAGVAGEAARMAANAVQDLANGVMNLDKTMSTFNKYTEKMTPAIGGNRPFATPSGQQAIGSQVDNQQQSTPSGRPGGKSGGGYWAGQMNDVTNRLLAFGEAVDEIIAGDAGNGAESRDYHTMNAGSGQQNTS